jgi:hypothetical protein
LNIIGFLSKEQSGQKKKSYESVMRTWFSANRRAGAAGQRVRARL